MTIDTISKCRIKMYKNSTAVYLTTPSPKYETDDKEVNVLDVRWR